MRDTLLTAGRCLFAATLLTAAAAEALPPRSMQDDGYRSLLASAPPSSARRADLTLPDNLTVPEALRDVLRQMRDRSPLFRRQLRRIADERTLVVRVHAGPFERLRGARAATRLRRSAALLEADVRVGDVRAFVELLAHELEHVIEQLDRVDLTAAAQRDRPTVWITGEGAFETARAIHAGRQVARDVLGFVR